VSAPSAEALAAEGWRHVASGKVRDLYRSEAAPGRILLVATDRVSAFDHVLEPGIPGKGALLTRLSVWWFDQLRDVVPNHLTSDDVLPGGARALVPDAVADRAMLVDELDMLPIEAVVRGFLVGSGWKEYQASGTVCGIPLPAGLENGDRLPEPIYTPAFKAEQGEHDENITYERTVELVGEADAAALRDRALAVFGHASAIAEARGVILADTKFEFGRRRGERAAEGIVLADEVLTSDSSRYWDAAAYAAGGPERLASFDKQIVRDWLAANWVDDGASAPPTLPHEIVERTAARYRELLERLTGRS
jgi:phosphoribosylaminoimidazole-succinocarboxamide synthase